ncbi:hypothetical protein GCM10022206_78040 [Streptomyces chiangmaiensis]
MAWWLGAAEALPTVPNSAPAVTATVAALRAAARLNLSVISRVLSVRGSVKLRQINRPVRPGSNLILHLRHT